MPPRYAYWTILVDNRPTAFRAREADELLPTLNQLKRKNADVVMRWFARGRLWDSPEAERIAQRQPKVIERRGSDWRPGGKHEDPRAKFARKKKPDFNPDPAERERKPWRDKPAGTPPGAPRHDRPWSGKPAGRTPQGAPRSAPPRGDRPWDRKLGGATGSKRPWNSKGTATPGAKRPWRDKPGSTAGRRPWGDSAPGGDVPPGTRQATPKRKPPHRR